MNRKEIEHLLQAAKDMRDNFSVSYNNPDLDLAIQEVELMLINESGGNHG